MFDGRIINNQNGSIKHQHKLATQIVSGAIFYFEDI